MAERRETSRRVVAAMAELVLESDDQDGERGGLGVLRDISETGARLLTNASPDESTRIVIKLPSPDDPTTPNIAVDATVIRVAALSSERAGLWRNTVAVQFQAPLTHMRDDIERLHAQICDFAEKV